MCTVRCRKLGRVAKDCMVEGMCQPVLAAEVHSVATNIDEGRRDPTVLELLPKLLRVVLAGPKASAAANSTPILPQKDAAAWQAGLDEVRAHRVAPVLGYMLRSLGLDRTVPAPYAAALAGDYRQTLVANTLLMRNLGQLLPALADVGVRPIVLKGALLANVYYPDLGARPMGDLDLLIRPEESTAVQQVFTTMGFAAHGEWGVEGAVYFRNAQGVVFDVHDRFTLYPPEMRDGITTEVAMPSLAGQMVKCWEPNALLVHLLVHLWGHRSLAGLILGWLLDLAFVVQRDGASLCPDRLKSLMPNPQQQQLLWRALGFLQTQAGLVIPEPLRASVDGVRPLSLEGILRDQRLARWGLPGLRGWLRLLACRMHLKARPGASYPSMGDLAKGLLPAGRE